MLNNWMCADRRERTQLAAGFLDMLTISGQLLAEFKHTVKGSHTCAIRDAHHCLRTLLE